MKFAMWKNKHLKVNSVHILWCVVFVSIRTARRGKKIDFVAFLKKQAAQLRHAVDAFFY